MRACRWYIVVAFALFLASHALALPEFNGLRDDDLPVFEGMLTSVSEKNARERIPDIDSIELGNGMMLIRIYAGFGDVVFRDGRFPLDLYEIRYRGDTLTALWRYPACENGRQTPQGAPGEVAKALLDYQFFDVLDSRADPGNDGGTFDGIGYLVQIRTTEAQREFLVANPATYQSPSSQRFRGVLRTLVSVFSDPECSLPQ